MNRHTPFLHNYALLAKSFSKVCLGPLVTAIFLNLVSTSEASAQISLFNQFIGDYDYVVTGGTLRTQPNTGDACSVTNTNTEVLSGIPPTATVTAAYLYWAGSQGPAPDYDITFEGQSLSADRTFTDSFSLTGFPTFNWFQGFKDVTSIVAAKGNGSYTFSDLTVDTGTTNPSMCAIQGVLSGWSLFVVYEDSTTVTQTNAINIYDGFSVSRNTSQDFTLSGILVADNPVAKFTSLLWEGDQSLGGANEFFSFEGNTLSDFANAANNPFNSSINSLGLGADTVYGVDLDTFDVSSFTTAGSTSVTGRVSSNNDLVILAAAVVGVSVASADLEVSKAVSNATPSIGDTITYSVTVTNQGDNDASGVIISDVLPVEVTYLSSSGPGAYDPNSGDWTVGNLDVGTSAILQINVQVDAEGTFSNIANVKASNPIDPDSTPGNADPTEDDQDTVSVTTITASDPDVLLVKRITNLNNDTVTTNGDNLATYIDQDDAVYPYDDNTIPSVSDPNDPAYDESDSAFDPRETDQWPTPLSTTLRGGIDGGDVMPNDEIEYTIYFLSSGDATAESVLFCDYVPTFTSFIPNGYSGSTPQATGGIGGADLSIELYHNGTTDYHTGANDGDSATYFGPGIDPANDFPNVDCENDGDGVNANPNGAVVVNLGDLPDATSDAVGAYGYVRFRARVK